MLIYFFSIKWFISILIIYHILYNLVNTKIDKLFYIIYIYTKLVVINKINNLSITTIDLNELNKIIDSSNEELNIKRDAIKMVRVFNNMLTISKEEQLSNECYLKDIRKKRKPLNEVIKPHI